MLLSRYTHVFVFVRLTSLKEGKGGVGGAWSPRICYIPCVYTAPPLPPSEVLHAAMRALDLVSVVRDLGTPPLNELTNNTVEGQNNRLKVMGLKSLPPLDWLLAMLAMEAEHWSRELLCARAWAHSMVRVLHAQRYVSYRTCVSCMCPSTFLLSSRVRHVLVAGGSEHSPDTPPRHFGAHREGSQKLHYPHVHSSCWRR